MKNQPLEELVEQIVTKLGAIQTDGHWHIGKIVAEAVSENDLRSKLPEVCRRLAAHPSSNLSYSYLRQCIRTFTYYPDIACRKLPESFYHVLANRVYHQEDRDRFEKLAMENGWNVNQLCSEIRTELLSRKEQSKSELGFDLQLTNLWYFNSSDPRFGKADFRGRIAGQIIANALYYFAEPDGLIVDLFAGSGTLGDVINKLPFFSGRKHVMLDLNPSDERIKYNDVITSGIPLPDDSASYIFLDPPYGNLGRRYYGTSASDLSRIAPEAFLSVMFSVIRECRRVLLPGKNVSLIVESIMPFDSNFIDLPFVLGKKFTEEGFSIVSKVYVPNQTMRNEGSMPNVIAQSRAKRKLISDCRELLTFKKQQCKPVSGVIDISNVRRRKR
jgi:hypothetical protein